MRVVLLLLVPVVVYFVLIRNSPVAPVVQSVTEASAIVSGTASATPGTDLFKAPLDRTREVLKLERGRVGDSADQ